MDPLRADGEPPATMTPGSPMPPTGTAQAPPASWQPPLQPLPPAPWLAQPTPPSVATPTTPSWQAQPAPPNAAGPTPPPAAGSAGGRVVSNLKALGGVILILLLLLLAVVPGRVWASLLDILIH